MRFVKEHIHILIGVSHKIALRSIENDASIASSLLFTLYLQKMTLLGNGVDDCFGDLIQRSDFVGEPRFHDRLGHAVNHAGILTSLPPPFH